MPRLGGGEITGHGSTKLENAALAVLAFKTRLKSAGGRISTQSAIDTLIKHGIIPQVKSSTIDRYIRELRLKQGIDQSPCVRIEASHPNEVWHIDFTVSKMCVAGQQPGTINITSDHAGYKRPRNERVWLCGIVDAYSRCIAMQYYLVAGESARLGIQHLSGLFSPTRDPRYPFGGIPEKLITDNGAFGSSALAESFCLGARIELIRNMPGQKQANGKIERQWRTLWGSFEGALAASTGEILTLEELNAKLFEWQIKQVYQPHPVIPYKTRIDAWAKSVSPYLRYATGEWAYLPVIRTVNRDMTVSVDNVSYKTNARLIGRKIEILMGIGGPVGYRDPDTGQISELEVYRAVKYGEYRATAKTDGQKALAEAMRKLDGVGYETAVMPVEPVYVTAVRQEHLSADVYPTTSACVAAVALRYAEIIGSPLPPAIIDRLDTLFQNDRSKANVQKITNVIIKKIKEFQDD
jgi:transposase InsO family protein